jgi:hypothetical protein
MALFMYVYARESFFTSLILVFFLLLFLTGRPSRKIEEENLGGCFFRFFLGGSVTSKDLQCCQSIERYSTHSVGFFSADGRSKVK